MNDPRLQDLLSALGAHVGITGLALNDDNVCRLVLDRTLVIDIEHLPGTPTVQVYSVVGGHPGNNAALCHRLLSANLFGQGTGGAVLALDEQRGEVLLVQSFDLATTTAEAFVAKLDGYVGYVEAWTAELVSAAEDDDDDDEPADDATHPSAFIRV